MKRKLSIPSQLKNLNEVEQLIYFCLKEENLDTTQIGSIILAVCESVNNAIIHGNNEDVSKFVEIRLECADNDLFVEIEDEGEGFDIQNIPDPTESNNIRNESGRGIFIIKSLADHVAFENNGSLIKIKFNLKRER